MSNIHHHLTDTTLLAYAAGNLAEHMSLVVATHLAMCPSCRNRMEEMEALGGVELCASETMIMANHSKDALFAMLDQPSADQKPISVSKRPTAGSFPYPLQGFLPENFEEIQWRNMAPGIKQFPLENIQAGRGTIRLLKIAPGITIPEHGHGGTELTLILKGSFSDEIGRFKPGDIADLDEDTAHQPIADTSEDCICLIATEAPLKFNSLLPKVMQYFVGM
ncbi:ChrR family anti-sigma-E factor [Curvivirga aplysinae]|uniref:ChrR family anti-sigma-E factor n=1 Tax=Curvivirga aplysinae TaxID=2529852 RepID=UPI0012BD294F|nr:ChrR family anti-sigma-E factor [Curvivirga aplysinae]MTI08897.1 anti-sigma factor [Curvivirga aplysinae]